MKEWRKEFEKLDTRLTNLEGAVRALANVVSLLTQKKLADSTKGNGGE